MPNFVNLNSSNERSMRFSVLLSLLSSAAISEVLPSFTHRPRHVVKREETPGFAISKRNDSLAMLIVTE
jgi:hypothetical protein